MESLRYHVDSGSNSKTAAGTGIRTVNGVFATDMYMAGELVIKENEIRSVQTCEFISGFSCRRHTGSQVQYSIVLCPPIRLDSNRGKEENSSLSSESRG